MEVDEHFGLNMNAQHEGMVKQGLTGGNAVNTHFTYQSAAFWMGKPNILIG